MPGRILPGRMTETAKPPAALFGRILMCSVSPSVLPISVAEVALELVQSTENVTRLWGIAVDGTTDARVSRGAMATLA